MMKKITFNLNERKISFPQCRFLAMISAAVREGIIIGMFSPLVFSVSTGPGFTVVTFTPFLEIRFRSASR